MSNNPWIQHVREYAKQHGLSYMCAATDPNCSKAYKEGKTPTTKTKTVTAPTSAPVKVTTPIKKKKTIPYSMLKLNIKILLKIFLLSMLIISTVMIMRQT